MWQANVFQNFTDSAGSYPLLFFLFKKKESNSTFVFLFSKERLTLIKNFVSLGFQVPELLWEIHSDFNI